MQTRNEISVIILYFCKTKSSLPFEEPEGTLTKSNVLKFKKIQNDCLASKMLSKLYSNIIFLWAFCPQNGHIFEKNKTNLTFYVDKTKKW